MRSRRRAIGKLRKGIDAYDMTRREIHARPKIIGARIKRTEDLRLLPGAALYRRPPAGRHAACGLSPERSVARAHPRHRWRGRARGAGRVAVFTAEDLTARSSLSSRPRAWRITTPRQSCHWRSARCVMSASRSSAWWRKAAIRPKTRSNYRYRLRSAAGRHRSGRGGASRSAAPARRKPAAMCW